MMDQYWFINCDKCTLLALDVNDGGNVCRIYGNSTFAIFL